MSGQSKKAIVTTAALARASGRKRQSTRETTVPLRVCLDHETTPNLASRRPARLSEGQTLSSLRDRRSAGTASANGIAGVEATRGGGDGGDVGDDDGGGSSCADVTSGASGIVDAISTAAADAFSADSPATVTSSSMSISSRRSSSPSSSSESLDGTEGGGSGGGSNSRKRGSIGGRGLRSGRAVAVATTNKKLLWNASVRRAECETGERHGVGDSSDEDQRSGTRSSSSSTLGVASPRTTTAKVGKTRRVASHSLPADSNNEDSDRRPSATVMANGKHAVPPTPVGRRAGSRSASRDISHDASRDHRASRSRSRSASMSGATVRGGVARSSTTGDG